MTTHIRHIRHVRNPEAPPRRVDRPKFGQDCSQDRWPLAQLRQRWVSRIAKWLRHTRQGEGVDR